MCHSHPWVFPSDPLSLLSTLSSSSRSLSSSNSQFSPFPLSSRSHISCLGNLILETDKFSVSSSFSSLSGLVDTPPRPHPLSLAPTDQASPSHHDSCQPCEHVRMSVSCLGCSGYLKRLLPRISPSSSLRRPSSATRHRVLAPPTVGFPVPPHTLLPPPRIQGLLSVPLGTVSLPFSTSFVGHFRAQRDSNRSLLQSPANFPP